jgi:hypothetical protein
MWRMTETNLTQNGNEQTLRSKLQMVSNKVPEDLMQELMGCQFSNVYNGNCLFNIFSLWA